MPDKSPKIHVHPDDKERLVQLQEENGLSSMKEAMAFLMEVWEERKRGMDVEPKPEAVESIHDDVPDPIPFGLAVSPPLDPIENEIPEVTTPVAPEAPPSTIPEVMQSVPPRQTTPTRMWCIHNNRGNIYAHTRLGPLVFLNQSDAQRLISQDAMYDQAATMEVTVTPGNAENIMMQHPWMDVSSWPLPPGAIYLKEWMSGVRPAH